mgnify:CR=1 FL=1
MTFDSKDWYNEGYDAWWSGAECPYDQGTEPYDQWHKGWCDADNYEYDDGWDPEDK